MLKPIQGAFGNVELVNFAGLQNSDPTDDLEDACMKEIALGLLNMVPRANGVILQEYLSDSVLLNGTKVELRVHVLVGRTNPLIVLLDPEFVVKHAAGSGDKYFNVNGEKQKLDYFGWTLLRQRLCKEEGHCDPMLFNAVDDQIRWAAVAGIAAAMRPSSIMGESNFTGEGQIRMFNWEQYGAQAWELFGLDFSLTWADGKIHAKLFDWNWGPALCLQPVLCGSITMSMMRQVYNVIQKTSLPLEVQDILDFSLIEDFRLETLVNAASSTASWFCPK